MVAILSFVIGHWSWFAPHFSSGPLGWGVWFEPPHAALGFGWVRPSGWYHFAEFAR